MAIKKQTSDKTEQLGMICLCCGSEMQENKFYKSRSSVVDSTKFSLCKNCAVRLGNTDITTLHDVLRVLNIPFIPEVYKEGLTKENLFSYYMTVLNNPNKKHTNGVVYQKLTYVDSPTLEQVVDVDAYIYANDDKLSELYSLFGANWSKEELLAMNRELDDMVIQYGGSKEDMATIDLYTELIRVKWLTRQAYDKADIGTGEKLSKLRQKMLKDNAMTLQDIKEKNSNDSLAEKIDFAEDRPIIPNKKYYDVSGINFMFTKLIKHMERFKGIDKSSVDDDYTEMQEYVDSNPHYFEEME